MLVFAAYAPHTPLLLPTVGKHTLESLVATRGAMDHLAGELYAAHPETILVLSGHGPQCPEAFSANLHDPYRADLTAFGDLTTQEAFHPDLTLLDALQRRLRRADVPFALFSEEQLDAGSTVPLLILAEHLPQARIVPFFPGDVPPKAHFECGRLLKDVVAASPRRIAVIACGDLSHALSKGAPAGLRKEGALFDAAAREAVHTLSPSRLLNVEPKIVSRAVECGYRPLLLLLGLLDGMAAEPEELSYEAPFGVGHLVAHFHLS
ncbi:AmmeMemoRadiSam system protein B [Candidatus Uhrbacteria bacterium]|nr:AmmeMemoRadiSam system protein B [Candidatus Uhrbacteria bacterium]MBI4598567.1 AmmeMemoRadiSam system protein B [Candidatus Uhrbacteria bacterium]